MGNIFSVAFTTVSVVAGAVDAIEITGSTLSAYRVLGLTLGRLAAALSASAQETLAVSIYRGSTISSSGSATNWELVTPRNLNGRSDATAAFTARVNSSLPGSSGAAAQLLMSVPWNTERPFVWRPYVDPDRDERPLVRLGERLQVRLSAPAAAFTMGGTLLVEEIGRIPGSTVN